MLSVHRVSIWGSCLSCTITTLIFMHMHQVDRLQQTTLA